MCFAVRGMRAHCRVFVIGARNSGKSALMRALAPNATPDPPYAADDAPSPSSSSSAAPSSSSTSSSLLSSNSANAVLSLPVGDARSRTLQAPSPSTTRRASVPNSVPLSTSSTSSSSASTPRANPFQSTRWPMRPLAATLAQGTPPFRTVRREEISSSTMFHFGLG